MLRPRVYHGRIISWSVGCSTFSRLFSASAIEKLRNIGISAHIDSGKTTLTERILFYAGRIKEIHEVRGKDKVGAKMDSMDLEREKGITIQSAATFLQWNNHHINVIDTPGHVDFTIEVERALRVLDGAILVLCGVGGVQSQSLTVDRQMRRYNIPRLCFINKLDRVGSNPWQVVADAKRLLNLDVLPLQIPMGLHQNFQGIVDVLTREAYYYDGKSGQNIRTEKVPESFVPVMEEKRKYVIDKLANMDEEIGELYLNEQEPTVDQLRAAIRRLTVSLKITPLFMGAAYKNKGVQNLLDGVVHYLPNPKEKKNHALDLENKEKQVDLACDPKAPFVGLAFKLEDGKLGQLTYMRVYQGTIKKGDTIYNTRERRKVRVSRLVRMHADEMVDIPEAGAGEIAALLGIECDSGTTFTGGPKLSLTSMHVPDPVISMSIAPKLATDSSKFTKALIRFQKEDPTFRLHQDPENQEMLASGMGELHLEIYAERIRREYGVPVIMGKPLVNYREAITKRAEFNYTHKKQSGGAGQFGRLHGYIEPLPLGTNRQLEFISKLVGNDVPPEFVPSINKGFEEAVSKGYWCGYPVLGIRVVIQGGASHPVDSNDIAFKLCAIGCFREAFHKAGPQLLEPMMIVEIQIPSEYQSAVMGGITQRRGMITTVQQREYGSCLIKAEVPLDGMFGYSTALRSQTAGKGEFSMEYKMHSPTPSSFQQEMVKKYQDKLKGIK